MSSGSPETALSESIDTRFIELVFPSEANHYGTLFGGNALSMMGKAAFVAATRHARSSGGHGQVSTS